MLRTSAGAEAERSGKRESGGTKEGNKKSPSGGRAGDRLKDVCVKFCGRRVLV